MNYTILIYESPADFAVRNDPEKQKAYWAAWPPYSKALKDAGVDVSGAGLQPPETATTLNFRADQRIVRDGPYADPNEHLRAFILINVPDLPSAHLSPARFPPPP